MKHYALVGLYTPRNLQLNPVHSIVLLRMFLLVKALGVAYLTQQVPPQIIPAYSTHQVLPQIIHHPAWIYTRKFLVVSGRRQRNLSNRNEAFNLLQAATSLLGVCNHFHLQFPTLSLPGKVVNLCATHVVLNGRSWRYAATLAVAEKIRKYCLLFYTGITPQLSSQCHLCRNADYTKG